MRTYTIRGERSYANIRNHQDKHGHEIKSKPQKREVKKVTCDSQKMPETKSRVKLGTEHVDRALTLILSVCLPESQDDSRPSSPSLLNARITGEYHHAFQKLTEDQHLSVVV